MKRWTIGLIVCVCLLIVAPGASATHGDPHGIPDAAHFDDPSTGNGTATFSGGSTRTQSFVALRSGKLLAAQAMNVWRYSGGGGLDVTMRLVNVDSNGQPEGEPLATTTVDGDSIPTDALVTLTGYFGSAAPRLVAGQTYGISITTSDGAGNTWDFETGNPYPDGRSSANADYDHPFQIWLVNAAPKIQNVRPKPFSRIKNRMPVIRATVTDSFTDLQKADIRFFVDGDEKRGFTYDGLLDRLGFEPPRNLSYGKHRVRIKATDEHGKSTVRKWSFKVVE